jgi:Carboxypeptidase regulatory-like domain
MRTITRTFAALLALLLSSVMAWGQLYSGSVTGLVTDPTSAVIPGARVVLTDEDKGTSFNAVTDASGRYLFRGVPPASYRIEVTVKGFQSQDRSGVRIDVDQNATVNFSLPVGNETTVVNVNAEIPLLSTEDASTGQVVGRTMIDSLPLFNREIMTLAYLTPGVVTPQNGQISTGTYGNNFVANGGRSSSADVLMDGVSTTNYEQNGSLQVISYMPSPDAVQEFKIQTSSFSAEFGFSGNTVVNMITRSGTNAFHGSAYGYIRSQKFDANNWFANGSGIPLPSQKWNDFGGSFGGPVKKNKSFFFADYDGLRSSTGLTSTFGVPSAQERTGDFGELCGYNGGTFDLTGMCTAPAGQLWDPYSGSYNADAGGAVRTAFIPFNNMAAYSSAGNPNLNGTPYQLAPGAGNLIDPVALKIMQYYPLPNLNNGTSGYQYFNNWIGSGANVSTRDQGDMKYDHTFNDQMRLAAKYSLQRIDNLQWDCFHNIADPCTPGPDINHAYLASVNLTRTFSPSLLLTVSYGFNRWSERETGGMGLYPNANPAGLLGLPNYMNVSGFPTIPTINLNNGYSSQNGTSIGTWPWTIIVRGQDTHQLLGTMSWIKGSHEVKFGSEGRLHLINFRLPGPTGGSFTYGNTSTSQNPNTGGDAMAGFLTGVGTQNNGLYEVPDAQSTRNYVWGGFILDNWKVNPKLTLNAGLRYDLTLPRTERYNRMNWLSSTVASPLQVPGLGPLTGGEVFASNGDRYNYDPDFTNFQPRFGFSWQPIKNTVVRGGYGIFYGVSRVGAAGQGGSGNQGWVEDTVWLTSQNNDGSTPWGRLSDPWPHTGPNLPPGNSLGLLNDVGFAAIGPDKKIHATPNNQSWSFGIQHELRGNILLDVNYLGNKGTHLYFGGDDNKNILGPQIENYSASQVSDLLNYVPNPLYGYITNPNSALSGSTIQAYQLQLPHPQFTTYGGDTQPIATSFYNALQAKVEKRFSKGLELLVTYNFSKSMDDASSSDNTFLGGGTSLQDPNKPWLERSVSLFDIPQQFQITHVYQLPFGRGKTFGSNWNPIVDGFLGGWQVNGTWSFLSGYPLQPSLANGVSLPTYGPQRPDLSGKPTRNKGKDWMVNYFANPQVFSVPANFALGTAPRTLPWARTPGTDTSNLSVSKSLALSMIREGMSLQYRLEAFNALNHPQFAGPSMLYNSSSFGNVTSQVNNPRQLQMALRLSF